MTWCCRLLLLCCCTLCLQDARAAATFRAASSAGVYQSTAAYVSSNTISTVSSGNITSLSVTAERNAVIMCVIEQHDNVAISFPAGWTQLYSLSVSATHRASVFYKISGNTETNPTVTHSGGDVITARCFRVHGVDANNLYDVAYAAQYAASSATVKSGGMTTVTAGDLMLYAMHVAGSVSVSASPTGTGISSLRQSFFSATNTGSHATVGMYYGVQSSAGATGPVTATLSTTAENHGVLMALHNGSTLSIALPSGTAANDVMLAAITVTPITATVTPPSGWTQITSTSSSTSSKHRMITYYKVAGASEPAYYTWGVSSSHSGAAGAISSFYGVNVTNPIEASAAQTTTSSASHASPSVTTASGNDMLVTIYSLASSPYNSNATYSGAWAPPSGMAEAVDERSRGTASSSGVALAMDYLALSSAGATGSYIATSAASGNQVDVGITATIALRSNNSLDHLEIDFPQATLSSCASSNVTIYACASSGTSCSNLYTGGVSGITLTPGGGSISIPAGSASVTSIVSQAAGSGTLAATSSANGATTCKNLATGAFGCGVTFAATGLSMNVPNFVAGKPVATTATACGLTNGSNTVSFYSAFNNPSSGTKQISVAPQTGGVCGSFTPVSTSAASPTSVSLTFNANVAPLCINYPDVGNVKLVSAVGSGSTTSSFTVTPDHFVVSNPSCVSGCVASPSNPSSPNNPGAANASGYAFMKSGSPFTLNVTAYNGASPAAITTNFGKESTPAMVILTPATAMSDLAGAIAGNLTCNAPSGACVNVSGGSVILGGFGSSTAGVASNTFLYDEAGIMTLTPSLYDPYSLGYLSIGSMALNPSGTVSASIGRFIPDHFTITKDSLNPLLLQPDFAPQITANATGTSSPNSIIDIDDSTGFVVGAKIRINDGGAGGNAMTAKVTALDATHLTLDTAISSSLSAGDTVVQEWGTYMGETFNAQFTLIAQDGNNNQTQNYQGAYAKLNPNATNNPFGFAAVSGATNLSSRLVTSTAASGSFVANGVSVVAPLSISKAASADGNYSALMIGIAPVDSDGVTMGSYDLSVGGSVNHTSIMDPSTQASVDLRYGRVRISNSYGSELLSLLVPVTLQYWNGTGYATSSDDSATTLSAASVALNAPLGSLSSATGASVTNTCQPTPLPNSITLSNGAGKFCLTAPGVRGSVILTLGTPTYLGSNSAVANFGVYKSPLIYRRENY